MMKYKLSGLLLIIGMLPGLYENSPCVAEIASYNTEQATEEDTTYDSMFEDMDRELEEITSYSQIDNELSFSTIYSYIKKGELQEIVSYITTYCISSLTGELKADKALIIQLMAVIATGSLMAGFSGKIGNISKESGFFVIYMMIVSLLLGIYTIAHDVALEAVNHISELMLTFIPAYSLATGYAYGEISGECVYQMVIFVIFLCENVICKIIFPLVKCSGIIGLVNKINVDDLFSKTVGLIRSIVSWIIKTMLAVVTGLNVIKGIMAPSLDQLNRQAFMKMITMLPGGNTAQTISDIILSSGILIKNAIGIAGAVIILVVSVAPVIKIWCIYISLRLVAALVQPVGDKRYSEAVNIMAGTIELILKGCGTAVLMFIISVMLMTILVR